MGRIARMYPQNGPHPLKQLNFNKVFKAEDLYTKLLFMLTSKLGRIIQIYFACSARPIKHSLTSIEKRRSAEQTFAEQTFAI